MTVAVSCCVAPLEENENEGGVTVIEAATCATVTVTVVVTTPAAATICVVPLPTDVASPPDVTVATEALLRSEEHTSELQSRLHLVCRLLLEKKKKSKVTNQLNEHSRDTRPETGD